MKKGTNVATGNTKNDKAKNTTPANTNAKSANTPAADATPANDADSDPGTNSASADVNANTPSADAPAANAGTADAPAANAGTADAPAANAGTADAPAKKARIPLKGVTRRGGGGGGKRLGPVYNIAEVMYGHITTKTKDGVKETAVMHHIINGEAIFVKEGEEVFIDFNTPGDKLYSFVANVNNKTARKTSLYSEVEADVPVLDKDDKPVMNADGTPKTTKAMVPAEGTAWHGFIVASPANAQKVYDNIKAMLTNPLTEGSELRKQITLLEPPFNLHDSAPATLDINTEVVEEGEGAEA